MKLNLNQYTLGYLLLMTEARKVGFKSSIYTKSSSFQEIEFKFVNLENVLKL